MAYSLNSNKRINSGVVPNIIDMTYKNVDKLACAFEQGLDCMIMQTDEDADRVIELFEQAYMRGYESPAEIEAEIYHMAGVNPDEFNALDREKIQNAVYRIWGCE